MNHAEPLIELVSRIAQGRLSSVELVESCLARIDRHDSQVHAWVEVDREGALRAAAQLDLNAKKRNLRGVLHGIPVGIKDIVDVAGLRCEGGSPILQGRVPSSDASLVKRLRQAGAIILGKTVTTEFACFDPPPTRNPWNLKHTPGGSSSGSAAAVASGMCLAAIGSQTGGSISRPASYCGICGVKPTFGRVSRTGMIPVAKHLDHPGPMCRNVADLAVMLHALVGFDRNDPDSSRRPYDINFVNLGRSDPPRLGLLQEFFLEEADEPVRRVTQSALEALESAKAKIETATLPESFAQAWTMQRRIMSVEAAEYHRRDFETRRDDYGPNMTSLIEEGLATPSVEYDEALRHQKQLCLAILEPFERFDALVTPATKTTAPASLETTGDPVFNSPWSLTGLPTVTIPCGLAEDGMPCGLQLIAEPFAEAKLLGVAEWCEKAIGFDQQPPIN